MMTNEQEKKLIENYDKLKGEHDDKWQREITLLETRVKSNFKDITIDKKGGTIAIRASLSDAETGRIAELDRERLKLDVAKDEIKINTLTYEILEIVTANPMLNKDWFANNRDKFSTEDMLKVILGYYDEMAERVRRVSSIKGFRKK